MCKPPDSITLADFQLYTTDCRRTQILVRYTQPLPIEIQQGRLTFAGWEYVEVEPGVFRQVDGDRVLALKQDAHGKRLLFVGPLAYFQVPWYETPALLLPLMGASLLVFFSTWIAGLGASGHVWWLNFRLFNTPEIYLITVRAE